MKKVMFFAFTLAALCICGSCEEKVPNGPTPPQGEQSDNTDPAIAAATEAVNALIAENGDFIVDTQEVKRLLCSYSIYGDAWQLDAQFTYDANFEKMESIVYNFGTPLWEDNNLPVLAFGATGMSGYHLTENAEIVECIKVGYTYDSRDIAITFTTDEGKTSVAKLTALSNDVLILDGEDYVRYVFKSVEGLECVNISATRRIAQLLENSTFDKSDVAEQLVGTWSLNTSVQYNNDWSKVISPDLVFGELFSEGLGPKSLTFEADGTGSYVIKVEGPTSDEDVTYTFNWQYNLENSTLTLTGDINREVVVKGFDTKNLVIEYIMSYDNVDTTHYCREIFVKKQTAQE